MKNIEAVINDSTVAPEVKALFKEVTSWVTSSTTKIKTSVKDLETAVEMMDVPEEGLSPEVANTLRASLELSRAVNKTVHNFLASDKHKLDEASVKKFYDLVARADVAASASIALVGELTFSEAEEAEEAEPADSEAELEDEDDETEEVA